MSPSTRTAHSARLELVPQEREPDGILISPGPCTPNEAGISVETIRRWEDKYWFPKRVHFTCHARGRCGFPIAEVNAWDLSNRERRGISPAASL